MIQAGLDWKVEQTDVYDGISRKIPGYKANIRDIDRSVLGIEVTDIRLSRMKKPSLLQMDYSEKGKYETAGSLAEGKSSGCLQNFQRNTLSLEMLLNHI